MFLTVASNVVSQMVTSEKHEKALLGGLEFLVGETRADLIAQVPKILMALYQSEIVEEEVLPASLILIVFMKAHRSVHLGHQAFCRSRIQQVRG